MDCEISSTLRGGALLRLPSHEGTVRGGVASNPYVPPSDVGAQLVSGTAQGPAAKGALFDSGREWGKARCSKYCYSGQIYLVNHVNGRIEKTVQPTVIVGGDGTIITAYPGGGCRG